MPEAKLDAHLTDRHSADAGVQESCGRVGTHFTHKGEFLFPADTVFLDFLSMRMKKKKKKYSNKGTKPKQDQLLSIFFNDWHPGL